MKKIGIIILIGFTLRLIVSCCDCPATTELKYTFNEIKVFHINNSGQTPSIVDNGIVPKEAYGIQIKLSLSQLAYCRRLNFMAFNSAYAFDCDCPPEIQYLAQDTISKISIITLNDFDNNHLADSEISANFKVLTYNNYITFQEFIDTPETIYYEKPDKELIDIYLMQPPTHTGEHKFQVEILLSNGTVLTATTTAINLE